MVAQSRAGLANASSREWKESLGSQDDWKTWGDGKASAGAFSSSRWVAGVAQLR